MPPQPPASTSSQLFEESPPTRRKMPGSTGSAAPCLLTLVRHIPRERDSATGPGGWIVPEGENAADTQPAFA